MPYNALAVANCFLERAKDEGRPLTHMQIQKLLYFAQGWHLAIHGRPVFEHKIEAWQYGPVVSIAFEAFRKYKSSPITELVKKTPYWGESFEAVRTDDATAQGIIKAVWDGYGSMSGIELSELSHEDGSPWQVIAREYEDGIPIGNPEIPQEALKAYFEGLKEQFVQE